MTNLKKKADYIRKNVIDTAIRNEAGHIAPSLSCVDILVSLYYKIMNVKSPNDPDRDRFILSKAHGCYALYSILSDLKTLPEEEWNTFYKGSSLKGCVERNQDYGLEANAGSLGHGLPISVGIAFGAKLQNKKYRSYCMVGDGELQEGSMWEAIQFAVKHKLSNLTIIVDNNNLQAMDFLEDVLSPCESSIDIQNKMRAFGCEVEACDGHDIEKVTSILEKWKNSTDISRPQVLVATTVKGYGLKYMENIPKFHFRLPTKEELEMGKRYE